MFHYLTEDGTVTTTASTMRYELKNKRLVRVHRVIICTKVSLGAWDELVFVDDVLGGLSGQTKLVHYGRDYHSDKLIQKAPA